jgi:hypothetical protein
MDADGAFDTDDEVHPEIAVLFSGNPAAIYRALAAAQAEFPEIDRTKTVTVRTRDGRSYTFSYATLDEVIRKTRPALAKNGLAVLQPWSGDKLYTILGHSSGAALVTILPFARRGGPLQDTGSELSYLRRYALNTVLGIAAEEDEDGNGHDGNHVESTSERGGTAATSPAATRKPDAEIRMPVEKKASSPAPSPAPKVVEETKATTPVAGPAQEADDPGIVIFSDMKLTKKIVKEAPDGGGSWVRSAFLTDTGRWVYTFETGATHADGSETVVAGLEKALTSGAPVRLKTRERKMTNGSVGYEVLAVS